MKSGTGNYYIKKEIFPYFKLVERVLEPTRLLILS
jgi:hypothetical protein